METDDFIEPFRRAGQEYIDSFKGDRKAMIEDLRRRAEAAGKSTVSLVPKRIAPKPAQV